MNPEDISNLRNQANSATQSLTSLTQNAPNMLESLRSNLNQIFAKDNPLIQERQGYLQNYLSAGDKARAEYLPQNSGQVFSPTQLQAMVSARQAGALAPLSTLNNLITGQAGSLQDLIGLGRDTLNAKTQALSQLASTLRGNYQYEQSRYDQQKQLEAQAAQQAFENDLAMKKFELSKQSGGSGDASSLLAALLGGGKSQDIPMADLSAALEDYTPAPQPQLDPISAWLSQPKQASQVKPLIDLSGVRNAATNVKNSLTGVSNIWNLLTGR